MFRASVIGLAMTLAGGAQAAIVISSDFKPQQTTEIMQSLTLDKFDSDQGTLSSAFLTLTGDAFSSLTLDNDSSSQAMFGYSSSAGLIFSSALGLGIPGSIFAPTVDLLLWQVMPDLAADDGDGAGPPDGGPDEQDFGSQAANSSVVFDVTAFIPDLSMAGGGAFGLDCVIRVSQTFIGGGGNIEASQATTAGCAASIEYNFDPFPHERDRARQPRSARHGYRGYRRVASA